VTAQRRRRDPHPTDLNRRWTDRGSASIWVLACAALVLVLAFVVVLRTGAVLARHRADTAADEAALAAATQIGISDQLCPAASIVATANGARLVACVPGLAPNARSGIVRVEVALDITMPLIGHQTVHAAAREAREPSSPG
jgi:secretion/DNA translocation related TadE-like protein